MKKMVKSLSPIVLGALVCFLLANSQFVLAAGNSTFHQTINPGTLATDIRSASSTPVTSPSVSMSAKTFSFACQSGGSASTGTFGTNAERIYVDNPDGADNGWNLTIAATGGASALWANGGATNKFDFNDSSGSGCTDGDSDTFGGQLTINPTTATTTTDYSGSSTTGITFGSSSSFSSSTPITLVNASAGSSDIWRGYVTGIGLSQTIPAEIPADAYSINLTLTVTAL
ncbi:MAG: hypothetical protein NTX66_03155 [Candidatus Falkowbacteria bacterium]|nr:hypothetical protein [Candidatus Falkowbacteria bacterium]